MPPASRRSAADVQAGRAQTQSRRGALGVDMDDAAFLRGLADASERLELRSVAQLQAKAIKVQNTARRLAPVDTGRLRASIIAGEPQRDAKGAYVEVGTNVEYGPAVEFGTQHSPAQPYMRPALLAVYGGGAA